MCEIYRKLIFIDVNDHPSVDPAYLKHPADIAVMAAALRLYDKATKHEAMAPLLQEQYHPNPKYDLQDLEQAKESVKEFCMSEYHVCGSVAMGAALDSRLNVKGVSGLRVADASAFPNNVSGNICSSVYTLAERAADIIKEDYSL